MGDLPDIDDESGGDIQRPNVKATGALSFSALLEKMRLTQVADRLVELFNAGTLPFGRRRKRGDDR